MNQPYANGSGFGPRFPPTADFRNNSYIPPSARPHSNSFVPSSQPPTHTLPPLNTTNYTSAFSNEIYPSRTQSYQPSMMTTAPDSGTYPASFAPYAPTATTHYQAQVPNYSQAPQSLQSSRPPNQQTATSHQTPSYTSSAQSQVRLPNLRPMPQNMTNETKSTGPGKKGKLSLTSASLSADEGREPIHVVGSQGRRGILPSAAGRPPAVRDNNSNGQKTSPTLARDSDGKYPCFHCTKTYLHAKHLKRHMLRHTGVRPYICGLCRDTFSRSDILKRHFQKCSVRRGNPTGENHLSHSRANKKLKADQEEMLAAVSSPTAADHHQMATYTRTSLDGALDLRNLDLSQHNYADGQASIYNRLSQSSGVKKAKKSSNGSNRGSMGGVNTSGYDPASYQYSTGHVTPDSITTSGAATPYTYPHEARSNQISPDGSFNNTANGLPLGTGATSRAPQHYANGSLPHIVPNGRGNDFDWSSYQFPSHDDYGNTQYHSGANTPHRQIKPELDFTALTSHLAMPFQHTKQ